MIAQLIPSPWELHPPLVHFPIVFLLSAVGLDVFSWWSSRRRGDAEASEPGSLLMSRITTGILIAGVVGGGAATLAGVVAYFTAPVYLPNADVVMNWHMALSLSALILFGWCAVIRWLDWEVAQPSGVSRLVALAAAALLVGGSWLGGYLVYHGGAGFDPALITTPSTPIDSKSRSGTIGPCPLTSFPHTNRGTGCPCMGR